MLNKRVKAIFRLSAVIILIFSCIALSLCVGSDVAEADAVDYHTTARQKMYYKVLRECIDDRAESALEEYLATSVDIGFVNIGKLNNVKDGSASVFHNLNVVDGSYYIESVIKAKEDSNYDSTWDYGSFQCRSKNGILGNDKGLSKFNMGFTQKTLFCGEDGQKGLYESYNPFGSVTKDCESVYDDDSNLTAHQLHVAGTNGDRITFFDSLVRKKTFGGNPPGGRISEFTDIEMYWVYYDTFFSACANFNKKKTTGEHPYKLKLYEGGEWKEYSFDAVDDLIGPGTPVWLYPGKSLTCTELANKLDHGSGQQAYAEALAAGETFEDSNDPDRHSGDGGTAEETCMSKAGTSLGWLGCPVLEDGVAAVVGKADDSSTEFLTDEYGNTITDKNGNPIKGNNGIYTTIKGMLEIDSKLVSSNEDDGTIKAWRIFLNIANIGLIILVIVIIFSQLTGLGIDNYGIKKILPRLIVTVLLIELSYIICQFAVDASNIVGGSAGKLLDGVSKAVKSSQSGAYVEYSLAAVFSGIFGGVAIAGVAAPTALSAIALGMPMGLIVCILALIPIVIAAILFFVMLGLRQVLAIVCVMLSPLAFLCYALPNTKSLFSKWFNLFKGVLIVYPICSLLYGVGQIIKVIVLVTSSGTEAHWWMMVIAVMCPFLPFLLAPSLVKSSFAALGTLSNKLQNVGGRVKGATKDTRRSLDNSDMYKDALAKRTGERLEKVNQKIAAGQTTGLRGKYNTYMQGRLRQQNAALASDKQRRDQLKDEGNYEAFMAGMESKQRNDRISNYEALLDSSTGVNIDGATYSSDSVTGAKGLEAALDKAIETQNLELALAAKKKLEERGDKGTEAIARCLDNHRDDADNGGTMKALTRSIGNDSNYKSKNREIFDFANDMAEKYATGASTSTVQKIGDRYGRVSHKFGYSDVRGLSDASFKGVIRAAENGDQASINLLREAATNQNSNIKGEQRADIEGGTIIGSARTYTHSTTGVSISAHKDLAGRLIDDATGKPVDEADKYT